MVENMTLTTLEEEILAHLHALALPQQREVLAFVRTLATAPIGVPGRELLTFAGIIEAHDLLTLQQAIDDFAARSSILVCDHTTARQYGESKNALRAKGRPIPENGLWIAAVALQYSLTLATRDDHFREVDGLTIVKW